jgi:glycosyltransferase involved in cell wall biosynthesis
MMFVVSNLGLIFCLDYNMQIVYGGHKFDKIDTGGERRISKILEYIEKKGLKVRYLNVNKRQSVWLIYYFPLINIINIIKIWREVTSKNSIILVDYSQRYQLLLANIVARFLFKQTIVVMVNAFYFSYRKSKLKNYFDRLFSIIFLNTAHFVIAGGKSLKNELQSLGVSTYKMRVIYPALRKEFFIKQQPAYTKYHNIVPKVLIIGRFHPIKGVEFLVEAIGLLHDKQAQYVIVGDFKKVPRYTNKVLKIIKKYDLERSIFLTGEITDVSLLLQKYQTADIFVLPSLWETSPSSLLEAMLMGLPVVACDVGGIPEVMVDGETGYLVKPGDPVSMSRAIKALIDDPEKRVEMGKRARERALGYISRRTWDDVGRDYYNTIVQLVERRTAAKPGL